MNWRTLIFGLIAVSFAASMFAETSVTGGGNFGKENVESIDGTGLIKLNGTTVANNVHVIGSVISQNGEIGSLDVIGDVNLTGTLVKEGGQVIGSIQTTRTTFEKPITLFSQKAIFTTSKLSGITVKQDKSFKGKQIIELRLGTFVDGPIHFESGKGEVLVYPGSQVLGVVTGGKIIKKS